MQNPQNNGHVLSITRMSGTTTIDSLLPAGEPTVDKTTTVEPKKATGDDDKVSKERGKGSIIGQEIR